MKIHRLLRHGLGVLLIALAATTLALGSLTLLPHACGLSAYAVTSSSMTPLIPPGSLVIVDAHINDDGLEPGSVIAFARGETDESVCVHRVKSIDREGGLIETKGDANDAPDLRLVPFEDVQGTVRAHVPLAGFVLRWIETNRTAFLGVIGALILASASLSFVLPETSSSKKGTECPNRPQQITKEA